MKKRKILYGSVCMLGVFVLWTAAVCTVDIGAIGPCGSSVGFSSLNGFVHTLTSVHMSLYTVTDWLGLVPIGTALVFAVLGLIQWINRKNILKVDYSILALGVFYIITIALYILFENVTVNYRPVLIDGFLEVSYPSSTTLLVMCVMPTAILQLSFRIKSKTLRRCIAFAIGAFIAFMVIGRLISGVHWFTDIIGSIFLSTGLVMMYYSLGCKK